MAKEVDMSTKYDPTSVEAGMYKKWLDEDVFKPNGNPEAKPYSIVLPPPNVTGKLHLGHAWNTTLQDMLIRQKRMQGYDTVWIPGMDHAGIATQAKVEAMLNEQGISRYDLGREKFVDKVWEWKDDFADTIHKQWAKLGLSLDYSRERFTLDDGLSKAVRKVFVDLYNQGLIYRGEYIINWDPKARTALSDIEVIHKDDQGAFYHVKYPFADDTKFNGKDYIEIATTRPETMMGDTAVAVNPSDERYKDLVGKKVVVPLVNRTIPIIADQYVDPEFGTGMVKITPAHDPNDFKVGNRHDLKRINTMNEDATMNENAGKYEGMDRFDARKAMVKDLKDQGLMIKIDPIVHSVGHSERTGVQVEARLSTQWFVKMKPLAQKAMENQKTKDSVNFIPERFEHTFMQWMENVHDWVISRQLWWGHRIPAWYNNQTGKIYVGENAPKDPENWTQDPDVLDTWFSSALWPFTTLGWPDTDSKDYQRYFPTNTLVTGYDLVFFWISRMIFQSLHFTGKRPFKNVLLHGLIRDEHGVKMSKSLGNGIDPMDVIDQYGADALRWCLSTGTTPGQDMKFSYSKVESAWNFVNKIWNASRYVIMNLGDMKQPKLPAQSEWNLADRWILSKLNHVVNHVTEEYDKFNFGEANRSLYDFIWNDFCDWYIEMSKEILTGSDEVAKENTRNILAYVLDQILRLLQPVMPFVTEKIWLSMPHVGKSLVVAYYPVNHDEFNDSQAESDMNHLIDVIKAVRNIRSEVNAPLSSPVDILVKTDDPELKKVLKDNSDYIDRFGHPNKLEIGADINIPKLAMTSVITDAEISIPLDELIDLNDEKTRLQKEVQKFEAEVQRAQKKLANKKFVENAPEAVVNEQKEKQQDNENKLKAVQIRLKDVEDALNK
ncbi:valine--tRNA ligase [Fructilactobacillus fructivorans]|uniref:Valine--tRNA ligase n=1 Tax=Fructilactobacillus fructivorans TaxID=1614 RepID=A0A0C1LXQ5_9LACO|nr:valine--tRNA ligase [Fructilactobacillus fructivorans]KID41575.1 Valyl-tRNA synthetase [Fructilactobacillus fructivorans]MCT0151226.1 valine--tRNA ligase [Fructilactobacillus fructivorans]MCT2867697.1 valine--tRNA ligase [Fructilactobacillus fructivorans]MCT2868785.1 valine--tRNA ligase [Fructilactobacillus fructivorans]MCT2874045.1 valine--tRNA ligase [Fructilactobacillus fructivorans]